MMDLNDIFAEEEARLSAEYHARVASGEEEKAIKEMMRRGEAEYERLVTNGAIEDPDKIDYNDDNEEDDEENEE